MPTWSVTVDIDAPPEAVWALVGDPTSVPRWYPKYVTADVDGDVRVLRTAEGGELRERLLERDEARRFYSYSVLSGAPVASHLASFEVVPEGGGSRVRWATQAEPSDPSVDLRERLVGSQTEALGRVKRLVEDGEG